LTATDPSLDRLYYVLKHSDPSDIGRHPFPRLTIPAVDFLSARVGPGSRVLEWGTGFSTIWFQQQGCIITSIEHDPYWHGLVSKNLAPPSEVLLRSIGGEYIRAVPAIEPFDVISIDGRCRAECAAFVESEVSAGRAKQGLIVIFDDSERSRYRSSLRALERVARDCEVFSGTSSVVLNKLTTVFIF
jgi:predicted O-methyltransferase YrrM